jgi:hypothetical protein
MERVEILDDITWGMLVKSWATGNSYLANSYKPPNYPRSIDEFNEQCGNATRPASEIVNGLPKPGLPAAPNVITRVPASIVGIAVLQYSPEVLSLRLPPKKMVEAAETDMRAGAAYPIPQFYDDFYHKTLDLPNVDDKLNFHAARIGDYSIRNCA